MRIEHLNAGILQAPASPPASCHCLLVEHEGRLVLIDTGIGLHDIARPVERIGQAAIEAAGFQFHESLTAARQIERLGYRVADVGDIVLTHADPDHAGGLADFPQARVHVSSEEHDCVQRGDSRYSPAQFSHGPRWNIVPTSSDRWFGLETRKIDLPFDADIRLVPLFGHTQGHCGVAVRVDHRWLLHVGDAYYLRVELETDEHQVSHLAALRAADDELRRASLSALRGLAQVHGSQVEMFGYHDFTEFPSAPESIYGPHGAAPARRTR